MLKKTILLFFLTSILVSCTKEVRPYNALSNNKNEAYFRPLATNFNTKNGKFHSESNHNLNWNKTNFDSIKLPLKFKISQLALQKNITTLKKSSKDLYGLIGGYIEVTKSDLIYTANIIKLYTIIDPIDISRYLEIYELSGNKKDGNILYTGYYTPELSYKSQYTEEYNIPLVVGKKRSKEVDTLCYLSNHDDLKNIKMQGSALVLIDNKIKKHVSFLRERSILLEDTTIKELIFKKRHSIAPYGAMGIPLSTQHSIAVDPLIIPLGSTILGITPKRFRKNIMHESRILLAQDTGGNIKGNGHVDLFFGSGDYSLKAAKSLHHYGKIYLLVPKRNKKVR